MDDVDDVVDDAVDDLVDDVVNDEVDDDVVDDDVDDMQDCKLEGKISLQQPSKLTKRYASGMPLGSFPSLRHMPLPKSG